MNKRLSGLLPLLAVLVVGVLLITLVVTLKPRPEPRPEPEPPLPEVAVVVAQPGTRALPVRTQGTVAPRREIELVSQVGGRVLAVAPQFVSGGFFEAGDWLVRIDPRDYEFALIRAQARVSDAERALASERGLVRQAQREWRDLGNADANDLFLRKPQLAAAEAALVAARADRDQAQLDLERTHITAPFAGRIRTTHVDLGQHIGPGTPVARIFDASAVEVRLSLTDQQAALVNLPLLGNPGESQPAVTLRGTLAGRPHQWQGRITRTDASVDTQSRMYIAVAEVTEPFNLERHPAPLLVGIFVDAEIEGRPLPAVTELPDSAVFRRNLVYTLDAEQRIQQKTVQVLHREPGRVWVTGELSEGDSVVVGRQGYLSPGLQVRVAGDADAAALSAAQEN